MQKITPCLWFNDSAEVAADFYASIFPNSKVGAIARYGEAGAKVSGREKGSVMTVMFQLAGQEFMGLNGGPMFSFTPAISFVVSCNTEDEIDTLFRKLSDGGLVLMELSKYPFSEKFAWLNDRFGVSWQLNLASRQQKIAPSLMFVGSQHGKAEEAVRFYVSQFKNSSVTDIERYGAGDLEPAETVKHAVFSIEGQELMAMDSSHEHPFTFTQAISFMVDCKTQEEVDALWTNLAAGGETQPCGWLLDKYGVAWQIVPSVLSEIMQGKDAEKSERVFRAMLQMQKLDIEALRQAAVS